MDVIWNVGMFDRVFICVINLKLMWHDNWIMSKSKQQIYCMQIIFLNKSTVLGIIGGTFVANLYLSSINFWRVDEIQTEIGIEFGFGYIPL